MIFGRSTFTSCLVLLAVVSLVRAQCTDDADCGGPDQAGLCFGGVCECGAGYDGNTLVDPETCSRTCTVPPVPDAVAFLVEPTVTMAAAGGNLVLNLQMDPYAKQVPTTVAFLHPGDGARCDMMPAQLGSGRWSQSVDDASGDCLQDMVYTRGFAAEVGQACWQTLPGTTESGSQYSIAFNQYATQVEVVQSGLAPFGQAAGKRDETTITREFRRNYTISVATSFTPSSAPFQIIAGGALLYRLVEIDYDILNRRIVVVVQTQTPVAAKLEGVAVALGNSSGISAVIAGPTTGVACDPASPTGKCDQFHTVTFSDEPCNVAGAELVLTGVFQCADGSAASTCGFTDLPANDTYTMPNLLLSYDACPRVVAYGVDTTASFLRLHDDVARTTPISAPALQADTVYGRCSVQPTAGAVFQSVTLSALEVIRQDTPNDVRLGNQLGAAFVTLISPAVSSDPSNPTWDFDLVIDAAFFELQEGYYLEATLDLVFANTGALTKRLVMPLSDFSRGASLASLRTMGNRNPRAVELVEVVSRDTNPRVGREGVACAPFTTTAQARVAEGEAPSESGSNTAAIAGVVAGIAGLMVAAAFIVVVVVKRRRRRQEDENDVQLQNLPQHDQSSLDIL